MKKHKIIRQSKILIKVFMISLFIVTSILLSRFIFDTSSPIVNDLDKAADDILAFIYSPIISYILISLSFIIIISFILLMINRNRLIVLDNNKVK